MEIKLNTNVEDTNDFRYIVNQKIEEYLLRTIRRKFRNGELKVDFEIIKQTDDYLKDAKLLIKNIQYKGKQI